MTSFSAMCYLLLFFTNLIAPCSCKSMTPIPSAVCKLELMRTWEDFEYFQNGDLIIAGVFTVNYLMTHLGGESTATAIACFNPVAHYYKNLLTFFFGIEEMNTYLHKLHNISLGYHIFDSCADPNKAVKSILQILSGPGKTVPNYSCTKNKIIGFIGDHNSRTTIPIAKILSVYRYTQICYGSTSYELSNRELYPTFFRTVQNYRNIYFILSKIMKRLGWTWIGVLASDDDSGEKEFQELKSFMAREGVCTAFVIKINLKHFKQSRFVEKKLEIIKKSSARIIIICGSNSHSINLILNYLEVFLSDRTLVLQPSWAAHSFLIGYYHKIFNGSLALDVMDIKLPDMSEFLNNVTRVQRPNDMLLENLWMSLNSCLSSDPIKNLYFGHYYNRKLQNCTGREPITSITSFKQPGLFPQVYVSVYTMARALNNLLALGKSLKGKNILFSTIKNQLHQYLKELTYEREGSTRHWYNEDNEFVACYIIKNWITFSNRTNVINYVGHFDPWKQGDEQFFINVGQIIWKYNKREIPRSQCSESCLPGSRKMPHSGIWSFCCYGCTLCSDGEMSNISDSENCYKCSNLEWPNIMKNLCIPKLEDFLSYKNEIVAKTVLWVAILCCVKTLVIVAVFIYFHDTPVVKANNKVLSFVLLTAILLGFLCVFLFLGHPVDITCLLRQMSFGVLFTIAISCVLSKTILVCIAFKATKPGGVWRKLIRVSLSNSLVLLCSSIQVMICVSWLSISPPFQELDTHSYQEKIIVQCNEGSVIGFYSVLGYMGILAAVSFILAFLARTLPDRFNEAKYITFSMLVFCSVWIAMIPAYLSTKGKYMVAVEIFAILASNTGLLGCIFFPKCYIILCKPKYNKRTYFTKK